MLLNDAVAFLFSLSHPFNIQIYIIAALVYEVNIVCNIQWNFNPVHLLLTSHQKKKLISLYTLVYSLK